MSRTKRMAEKKEKTGFAEFDDAAFAAYQEAGVFNEEKACFLWNANISPVQAARQSPEEEGIGCYKATAGYKFANGDLSIEEVA